MFPLGICWCRRAVLGDRPLNLRVPLHLVPLPHLQHALLPPSPLPLSGPLPVDPLPASLTPRRATCAYFSSICRTSAVTKWRRARASCFAAGKYCRALMFNPRGEGHDGTARRGNRADDSAYRARPPCVPPASPRPAPTDAASQLAAPRSITKPRSRNNNIHVSRSRDPVARQGHHSGSYFSGAATGMAVGGNGRGRREKRG